MSTCVGSINISAVRLTSMYAYSWYLRDGFKDLIYFLFKVHIQEAVSLVQHQMLEQFQAEALHVTVKTSAMRLQQYQACHMAS